MKCCKSILFFLFIFLSLPSLYANPLLPNKSMEVSVAGGFDWLHTNNTFLVVSPVETDSVRAMHVSQSPLWKIGLGYHLFENALQKRQFFNDLLLELNLYHTTATIRGDVWKFQLPELNDYSFRSKLLSTRVMLDVKPSLFTIQHFTPYPILGIGVAWNTLNYHETVTDPAVDPSSYHSLRKNQAAQFAYDLGMGVRTDVTSTISASVEYLYSQLGHIVPSSNPSTEASLLLPPKFTLRTQSILFGISWKI